MADSHYRLGTVSASEAVIRDLYLNLRVELLNWASVTQQTPQPRMGYIGQHLTSVVTGFPGGRSGARGKDLVLPDGHTAEIKTCYRIDQLGSCNSCGQLVASIELCCPLCGSTKIHRKDDSKWLISPKHDADMRRLYDPTYYYFVLFDFEDLLSPTEINARIWRVEPTHPGFANCIVDYYFNIKARSQSGAPFNLWPYMLKFQLMEPVLIYHAKIDLDNNIRTLLFPGSIGLPVLSELGPLTDFVRSRNFTLKMVHDIAEDFEFPVSVVSKAEGLVRLEKARRSQHWSNRELVESIIEAMYSTSVAPYADWLPG